MLKIKVLFLQCYGKMQHSNAEPLAVETLAGALKERFGNSVNTKIAKLDYRNDPNGVISANKFSQYKFDIICISIPQSTFYLSLKFIENIKKTTITPLIILGHALPTNNPQPFLLKHPDVLIVRGWGEEAIVKIVELYLEKNKDWQLVPNIVYNYKGSIAITPIKYPDYYYSPFRKTPQKYYARIEASRGCHYNKCTFCTRPPNGLEAKGWIRIKLNSILNEVKSLKRQSIFKFTFTDEDLFGNDLNGAKKMAVGIKKIGDMNFSLNLRVDSIWNSHESNAILKNRFNLLKLFKDAGLSMVFIGIESLSNSQLKRYRKGIKVSESIRAIKLIEKLEIQLELGFILFDPLMNILEFKTNVKLLERYSLWKYVGQIFNRLRIQSDCTYVNLLNIKDLLREYDPNTMEYYYEFLNPTIKKIAEICIAWKDEVDEIYLLARNVQRISYLDKNPCSQFVYEYRQLQVNILKSLCNKITLNEIKLSPIYKQQRYHIIKELKIKLLCYNKLTLIEKNLIKAINNYLILHADEITYPSKSEIQI
jgi:radical SAM superfamily enzyme YgiQ (UPF0313 family)